MKAISLWQPWAQAMALGLKRNETRSWPTLHRGDLVICASKKKLDDVAYSIARCHGLLKDFEAVPHEMQFGVALCVVSVLRCVSTDTLMRNYLEASEYDLGDYSPGRFVWVTHHLRVLKAPVPVVGRQGLWELPEDVAAQVRQQLSNSEVTSGSEPSRAATGSGTDHDKPTI